MTHKIILDCDPGHDDAMAILLAHGSPEIELLAITTVAGNQTLAKTSLNARRICTVAGITDIPLAAGCDRPLVRDLVTGSNIHGESGLDGPSFPEPTVPLVPEHAIDLMVDTIMASSGDVWLVPTGPLTNVAMALRKEPRLADHVPGVILMGGSWTRGNVTPAAEFNIFVDPEAAAMVFAAGWPVTMVGLDLTHQAKATPAVVERIAALGTPLAQIVVDLLAFYGRTYRQDQAFASPPVHDPCAVARLIDPNLVQCVDAAVRVETRGEWTRGMTVTDFAIRPDRRRNVQVATTLDFDGFWNVMLNALQRIGTLERPAEGGSSPPAHPAPQQTARPPRETPFREGPSRGTTSVRPQS